MTTSKKIYIIYVAYPDFKTTLLAAFEDKEEAEKCLEGYENHDVKTSHMLYLKDIELQTSKRSF